jgi:hypothetical protein
MEGIMKLALDISPTTVLGLMRGPISDARIAYPDVLHVEVRDTNGALWRLATQDAEWSPRDPAALLGRSIEGAEVMEGGSLCCRLSDDTALYIEADATAEDGVPYWELISPDGIVLQFGPGARWQISSADEPLRA